jgi:hypothetical protein
MSKKCLNEKPTCKKFVEGIVTVRKCDACGHHEIGITAQNGTYIPLKPGMKIRVMEEKSD